MKYIAGFGLFASLAALAAIIMFTIAAAISGPTAIATALCTLFLGYRCAGLLDSLEGQP